RLPRRALADGRSRGLPLGSRTVAPRPGALRSQASGALTIGRRLRRGSGRVRAEEAREASELQAQVYGQAILTGRDVRACNLGDALQTVVERTAVDKELRRRRFCVAA